MIIEPKLKEVAHRISLCTGKNGPENDACATSRVVENTSSVQRFLTEKRTNFSFFYEKRTNFSFVTSHMDKFQILQ